MNKFIFHKDYLGIVVYRTEMQDLNVKASDNYFMNYEVSFDPALSKVVPPPFRMYGTRTFNKLIEYINVEETPDDGVLATVISVSMYQSTRSEIDCAVADAVTEDEEITSRIAKSHFYKRWKEVHEDVEETFECEFEIVDIEYPADERIMPLRNFDQSKINYFEVDSKAVAIACIHRMCQDAGLHEVTDSRYNAKQDREYSITSYSTIDVLNWTIEGKTFRDAISTMKLSEFSGLLNECMDHINKIESAIRQGVNMWLAGANAMSGATLSFILAELNIIQFKVRVIKSKLKTQNDHDRVMHMITSLIDEIKIRGLKQLEEDLEEDPTDLAEEGIITSDQ